MGLATLANKIIGCSQQSLKGHSSETLEEHGKDSKDSAHEFQREARSLERTGLNGGHLCCLLAKNLGYILFMS